MGRGRVAAGAVDAEVIVVVIALIVEFAPNESRHHLESLRDLR